MKRLIVFIFLISSIGSSGQSLLDSLIMDDLTKRQLKSFGRNAMIIGDPYWAIDFFEKYLELKEDDLKITFLLADAYFIARDYEMAEATYLSIVEQNAEDFPLARFNLARAYMTNGKYEEALAELEEFKKAMKGHAKERSYRKKIKTLMEACEMAPALIDSALKVVITHVDTSVNKAHVESSPVPINDSVLVYSSMKVDSAQVFKFEDYNKPKQKLYVAERSNNNWVHKKRYLDQLNNAGSEISNLTFTRDKKTIFFTVCNQVRVGKKQCNIYRSVYVDSIGDFSLAEKLPEQINDKKAGASMASVGVESKPNRPEKLALYYVSERKGGRGGKDIWFSVYDPRRDRWKEPRNAGNKVNTDGDEITPFYDKFSATLYFSSDGHPGIGGFDIFKAEGQLNKWSEAENVGYPINTGYDDIYFSISEGRESGFLVSNRKGGVSLKHETCCDDIYEYRWSEYIKVGIEGEIYAKGDTAADGSKKAVDNAIVNVYINKGGDLIQINSVPVSDNGKYDLTLDSGNEYVVEVESDGYSTRKYDVNTKGFDKPEILKLSLGMTLLPQGALILPNVGYGFNETELNETSKNSLDTTLIPLMMDNGDIIVEISSHTDAIGNEKYNQKLSQKRADNVAKYIIDAGVEKERVKAVGYGESQPIAPNTLENGEDNPEGREKNRRTEIKIIGKINRAIFSGD